MSEYGRGNRVQGDDGNRITVCSESLRLSSLIDFIRKDREGGNVLRTIMEQVAFAMGSALQDISHYDLDCSQTVIVSIPRSGIPIGIGLQSRFSEATSHIADVHRSTDIEPIQDKVLQAERPHILLADGVIVTGTTMDIAMRGLAIPKSVPITGFAAIATREGIDSLMSHHPNMSLIVGQVEEQSKNQWDPHAWAVRKTIAGMGNLGGLVSK